MVLDRTVDELVQIIGHDGSEIVRPPHGRRGHYWDEILDVLFQLNYFGMEFEINWESWDGEWLVNLEPKEGSIDRVKRIMSGRKGIVQGHSLKSQQGHTVAWDGFKIYDPSGFIYDFDYREDYNFNPVSFLWISEIKS
jgi:hypothetical protein